MPERRQRWEASDKETIERKLSERREQAIEDIWERSKLRLRGQQMQRSLGGNMSGMLAGGWGWRRVGKDEAVWQSRARPCWADPRTGILFSVRQAPLRVE